MGLFTNNNTTNTSTSTETNSKYQQDYFDKLLGGASDWLNSGGLQGGNNYVGNIENSLAAMASHYGNVLSGNADRSALNQAKQANMDAAQTNFERSVLPGLTDQAQQAGQVGSSRSGIAAGLAASDMQNQVGQQNAAMEYQWQQAQQANQNNAAQGMLNLAGGLTSLQNTANQNTDQAKLLQSLMAFQNLISGDMGGTSTGTSTATQSGGGGSIFNNILGAGAIAMGI